MIQSLWLLLRMEWLFFFFFFLTPVVRIWVGLRGRWTPSKWLHCSDCCSSPSCFASSMWLQAFWPWNKWWDLVYSCSTALFLLASCHLQDPILSYYHSVWKKQKTKTVATISVWIVHLQQWGNMRWPCHMFHGAGWNSRPGDWGDFKALLRAHSFTRIQWKNVVFM